MPLDQTEPRELPKMLAEVFWCDRWTGSSAFLLPLLARGLYREMLSQAWRRGAQLPADHAAIRRACGCSESEWRRAWPLVERYWQVDGDVIFNPTQRQIYSDALERHRRLTERAAAGGRGKAARHLLKQEASNAQAMPDGVPEACPLSLSLDVTGLGTAPLPRRFSPAGQASPWKRTVAIAHAVMDSVSDSREWSAEVKARCAQQGIPYGEIENGRPLFARALDYVEGVRARRKVAS